jgi:shikimate kinase
MPVDDLPDNIYLIGPMGSGKTTIGLRIAKFLNMKFFDSDRELETHTGASVNLIFDVEGEIGFRDRETFMLEKLTAMENVIVATGGGAVLRTENCEMLSRSGLVVYLQTSVSQQLKRLRRDRTRPLLQEGDRERKLTEFATSRNPLYEKLADIVFPPHSRGPDMAARQLADIILAHRAELNTVTAEIENDDE